MNFLLTQGTAVGCVMDEMRESEIFADGVYEGEMETMARAND